MALIALLHRLHRHKFVVMLIFLTLMLLIFNSTCLSHESHVVEYLPGFPGKLPFKFQTGYIGVGEKEEVQLFYYFFESESNNPEEDPLVLWLTGGPGCSGLWAIIYDVGPLTIDYAKSYGSTTTSLKVNDYSWTKVANILFLDQPVGTGFSYSRTWEGYYSSDTTSSKHTYDFLQKWLINNPKYLKNPLYISGDSYAGIILPQVVDKVYDGIEVGSVPLMNMKGYSLGNPVTDTYTDNNGKISYAHGMGLLSDKLYQSAKELCHGNYVDVDTDNVLCQKILERVNQCLEKIGRYHILDPWCDNTNFLQSVTTTKSRCREDDNEFCVTWANDKSAQKALYVGKKTEWVTCNMTILVTKDQQEKKPNYVKNVASTIDYHKKFTKKNCRALIYSGDHDILIPHTSTEKWIDSLNLSIQSDWRPWFIEGQVAGYTMTYGEGDYELTYATVKGAGHIAPWFKPVESFAMIRRWFDQSAL